MVVDDEPLARSSLLVLMRRHPEIEIIAECTSGTEALTKIRATSPDLLFLDVEMPECDGFDVLEMLGSDLPPAIVFVTAYDKYALRAFEIHAVDYLLKPFTRERLSSAVEHARREILLADQQPATNGTAGRSGSRYTTRIVFKSRGRIVFLPVSDIRWISAEENYVRISTQTETHLLRETMARLEEKLDPEMFLRVHRSSIVNLQHVKEVRTETDGEYAVVLVNGEKLTMSRGYRSRINEWLTHS